MRPLGSSSTQADSGPKYTSWTEQSGQRPGYAAPPPTPQRPPDEPVSAQNMDPHAAQEFYRQQSYQHHALGGNDSGSGSSAVAPAEAEGFNAGGCVPFGLFAFANGQVAIGVLGLICGFIPFASLIYVLIIGFNGKKLAWQGRRFNDVQQFVSTMDAWNTWGIVIFVLNFIIGFVIGFNEGMNGF
ncbi:MAG: hypothetical protein R3F46_00860 [bacterium]